mgnify:CR=1 FL=1|tara:strand:+ start:1670 stop:2590 length:921 start_codon:yes stop_codon:yes gene_type:complete
MRVLIIGASSFIGTHLIQKLENLNEIAQITYTYFSNKYYSNDHDGTKLLSIKCDVRNIQNIELILDKANPDVIIFMASTRYFPAPLNINDHGDINTNGLKNLIDCLDKFNRKPRLIFVNSGAAKLPKKNIKINNSEVDSYTLSKLKASEIFNSNKNIKDTEVRLFTPYGPKDHEYRLIQSSVIKIIKDEYPILRNPNSMRDYIYVEDVIDVLIKIIFSNQNHDKIIEIGSSNPISTKTIIEKIYAIMDVNKEIKSNESSDEEQILYMKADLSVAKEYLDWAPKINLDEGIYNTVKWIKENYKAFYE